MDLVARRRKAQITLRVLALRVLAQVTLRVLAPDTLQPLTKESDKAGTVLSLTIL